MYIPYINLSFSSLLQQTQQVNGSLAEFSTEDVPLQSTDWYDNHGISDLYQEMSPLGNNDTHQPALPPWGNEPFLVKWTDYRSTNTLIPSIFDFRLSSKDTEQEYKFNAGRALYQKNVSEVMSNITDSMTNCLRSGRNATVAKGVVLQPDTIVLVQWCWLTLPIALVALDFVFLAFVICLTSSQGAPLWKSGLIPLFFHGLEESFDGQDKQQQQPRQNRRLETRDEMEEEAANMKVRLRRSQDDRTAFVVL